MRWLIMLMLAMTLTMVSGCVFSDDGTPDTVVVDHDNPPATSSTTIIDNTKPDTPDADVDVNVDATK